MSRYLVSRLWQALVTLLLMTVIVFGLARLSGNPVDVMLSQYASDEQYRAMISYLGLDKPLWVQYWDFISHAVRGDFGQSIYFKQPAFQVVMQRFPATMQLGVVAVAISIAIAIPFGVVAAVRRDTAADSLGKIIAVLGQAVPNFWLGLLLIQLFAVQFNLFPTSGSGGLDHFVLPALTLGWYMVAGIMRMMRSAMLDVLDSEFVKLARIKGLPERSVIWKHSLKNALIPVVTFIGLIFAQLLVGSIVVETVFAWPGVGQLSYQAVVQRDYPLLQTVVFVFTAVYVLVNLLVDTAYAYLDPRIRYQ